MKTHRADVQIKTEMVYLVAIMDLWSREIVSYRTSRHINLGLVKDVMSCLRGRGLCGETIIHSDIGWTYTHKDYIGHLKTLGGHQSM